MEGLLIPKSLCMYCTFTTAVHWPLLNPFTACAINISKCKIKFIQDWPSPSSRHITEFNTYAMGQFIFYLRLTFGRYIVYTIHPLDAFSHVWTISVLLGSTLYHSHFTFLFAFMFLIYTSSDHYSSWSIFTKKLLDYKNMNYLEFVLCAE